MGYKYDVFLSYRKSSYGIIKEWLATQFLDLFYYWLGEALEKDPVIFIDDQEIVPGQTLPASLKMAIARSRCLVAIWSNSYFRSDWCVRESYTMRRREEHTGYRTDTNPNGLIIPIVVSDCEKLPKLVDGIIYADFRKFFIVGEGFKKTELHTEFQTEMRKFTQGLAQTINSVPEWQAEWLQEEWFEVEQVTLQDLLLKPGKSFGQPTLR